MLSQLKKVGQFDEQRSAKVRLAVFNEKHVYLILEYCNGGDMLSQLKKVGQFDEQRSAKVRLAVSTIVPFCATFLFIIYIVPQ
jgi:hypothetical protein